MKIKFLRNYRKVETGNMVYVYTVSGSQKDLAAFEAAQGDNHTVDEETGTPLWFSTRFVGDEGALAISKNGKVFADTSEFDKAASLCEQHKGTALGDQMARVMAEKLLAGFGSKSSTPASTPKTQGEGIDKL
jgi:hypothetical protein